MLRKLSKLQNVKESSKDTDVHIDISDVETLSNRNIESNICQHIVMQLTRSLTVQLSVVHIEVN